MDLGASLVLITKYCEPYIKGPQWQWQQEERDRRTCVRDFGSHGTAAACKSEDGSGSIFGEPRSWNNDRGLQELRLEGPRALRVKVSPSSQTPNQQLHWKTHGCAETRMEHQILEFDLLDI